ncbi:11820_t:CDS:2 [Gigaspora rosea]|nr:11820_t:CDS:2 [Gigaspora rosea]
MSAITTKFVTDYKLTNETNLEEPSQYAPEILELLTTSTPLVNKEKRHQAHNRLQKGYEFSKEQAFALIPHERIGRKGETIKETAQCIIRGNLSERDIKVISRALVETSSNHIVTLSQITRSSNKIQKEHSDQHEDKEINFSDHFSVTERLNLYDVSNIPNKQALVDVMIVLCIRPAEIKNLRISNGGVTRELLTWIQEAISSGQLRDPGKLGSTYLSTFLKKDEFIPETESPNTYASEAFWHSPDNHSSPSKRYTIVNMQKRGEPYNLAKEFKLFDKN